MSHISLLADLLHFANYTYRTLIPVLTKLVKIGSPRQTKHSIRCIQKICKSYTEIFETVFEVLGLIYFFYIQ